MASDSIHIAVPEAIRSKNESSDDDVNVHFILSDGTVHEKMVFNMIILLFY